MVESVSLVTLVQIGQEWGWELTWAHARDPWHLRPWEGKGAERYRNLT